MNMNACAPAIVTAHAAAAPPVHPATKLLWAARLLLYGALMAVVVLGGPLVSLMGICAVVLALLTDLDGLTRHIIRTVTLIAAVVAGSVAGPAADRLLVPLGATWSVYGIGTGSLCVGGVVMIVGMVISLVLGRVIRRRPWLRMFNSTGGAMLGAVEGGLMVAATYWTLAMFSEPLGNMLSEMPQMQSAQFSPVAQMSRVLAYFDRDPAADWMRQHNLVADVPIMETARTVTDIATDRAAVTELTNSAELRSLLSHGELASITAELQQDEKLRDACARRDVRSILACASTSQLFDDPRVMKFAKEHLPELKSALQDMDCGKLSAAGERLDEAELNRLRWAAKAIVGQVQTMTSERQRD
ncbi:MAG: CvpA family protein [Phycisphaerae bacterium]|nr:CvpA family protein [Phycisphaerae bacterium]